MTERPPLTWAHAGWAAMGILAFAITGFVISGALLLMFDVGWMLIYVLWPFFLLQIIFSLIFHGIFEVIAMLFRGKPAETEAVPDANIEQQEMPWLRANGMWIGLFLGVTLTAVLEFLR